MKHKGFTLTEVLVSTCIFVVILLIIFSAFLFKWNTDRAGTHTGFVTAVEQEGFFIHNYVVYFKTNKQSSQEDRYCVRSFDSVVAEGLRESQRQDQEVTVNYDGDRGFGLGLCSWDRILGFDIKK